MAYDENGNVIGYIDEDGTVRDFTGKLIGYLGEDGTIHDVNGNIIGKAGDYAMEAVEDIEVFCHFEVVVLLSHCRGEEHKSREEHQELFHKAESMGEE